MLNLAAILGAMQKKKWFYMVWFYSIFSMLLSVPLIKEEYHWESFWTILFKVKSYFEPSKRGLLRLSDDENRSISVYRQRWGTFPAGPWFQTSYCGMNTYSEDLPLVPFDKTSNKLQDYLKSECFTLVLKLILNDFPKLFCSFSLRDPSHVSLELNNFSRISIVTLVLKL